MEKSNGERGGKLKMYPNCIPCLLSRVIYETSLVNPNLANKTIKNALKILAKEYSENANTCDVATLVHRKTYETLKNFDPYKKLKKRSNKIALELLPKVEKLIEKSDDKLKTAILCSIIGNILDFGIKAKISSPEELKKEFDVLFKEGLYEDDVDKIREYLERTSKFEFENKNKELMFSNPKVSNLQIKDFKNKNLISNPKVSNLKCGCGNKNLLFSKLKNKNLTSSNSKKPKILYFADNVGEIVFDKLLCKELKKFNTEIIFVVKGKPILTDAVLKDADEVGIKDVVDKILTTNSNAVGINFNEISKELKKELKNADLIICKGMALYESFSEKDFEHIVYLLRTKCDSVAYDLGLSKDVSVAKFVF